MRSLFEKLSKYALLRAIIYIVVGVLLLFAPQAVMNILVYILAAYVIVMGVINIVGFLRHRSAGGAGFELVSGVLLVVLGIILLVFTKGIISILPIFLGVLLALAGAYNLAQGFSYGRLRGRASLPLILLSVLTIIGGIVVVVNPFASAVVLFRVFGVFSIELGVNELIAFLGYRKLGKD